MLIVGPLLAALALAPADTTVIVTARSFLWLRRPLVQVVQEGGRTELLITARDPQFFARPVATLYASADTAGKSVAVVSSDSSYVDARYSTNRHSLRFTPTTAQWQAWAAGTEPALEVGGTRVKLSAAGRQKLAQVVGHAP